MSKPITLRMFVTRAGSSSSKPGDATTELRLNLNPKTDKVDDANVDHFPDEGKKSGSFECQGIASASIDGVVAGRRAKVTIEFE